MFATSITAQRAFIPRLPDGSRVAAVFHGPRGHVALGDTLTGYGRKEGYDSLANARRAAYMLTRGGERGAAGVYQSGNRFYVRAVGAFANPAGQGALTLLHLEGDTKAHLRHVRDPRLLLLVDGSTKVWSRDAHHKPPAVG